MAGFFPNPSLARPTTIAPKTKPADLPRISRPASVSLDAMSWLKKVALQTNSASFGKAEGIAAVASKQRRTSACFVKRISTARSISTVASSRASLRSAVALPPAISAKKGADCPKKGQRCLPLRTVDNPIGYCEPIETIVDENGICGGDLTCDVTKGLSCKYDEPKKLSYCKKP